MDSSTQTLDHVKQRISEHKQQLQAKQESHALAQRQLSDLVAESANDLVPKGGQWDLNHIV